MKQPVPMRVRTRHASTKFAGLSAPSATGGTRQLLRLFPRQVFGLHLDRMQSLVKGSLVSFEQIETYGTCHSLAITTVLQCLNRAQVPSVAL